MSSTDLLKDELKKPSDGVYIGLSIFILIFMFIYVGMVSHHEGWRAGFRAHQAIDDKYASKPDHKPNCEYFTQRCNGAKVELCTGNFPYHWEARRDCGMIGQTCSGDPKDNGFGWLDYYGCVDKKRKP